MSSEKGIKQSADLVDEQSESAGRTTEGRMYDEASDCSEKQRREARHFKVQWLSYLPNIITISRIIALGPLLWCMWHQQYQTALIITFFAGLSDGLDGFLAKRFGWQGWWGGILDPLADKIMMMGCYAVMAWQAVMPMWLFVMVVLRDVVIVLGTTYYHFRIGKLKQAKPTFWSKCNTVMQILLLLFLLLSLADWWHLPFPMTWFFYAVGFTTLTSGIQYVMMGRRMARQERKAC